MGHSETKSEQRAFVDKKKFKAFHTHHPVGITVLFFFYWTAKTTAVIVFFISR